MKAILDIGSNSVRLMLWANGKSLLKRLETTRLGEGLSLTGEISPAAMERTLAALVAFSSEARAAGAEVYAFATAAVRSARNGAEFCERARARGIEVDVVSGENEALLALYGALGMEDGGVIDIGGASTEICLRRGGKIVFSKSLGVGAVRLHDLCGDDLVRLSARIGENLQALGGAEGAADSLRVYAVGGTATALACLKLGLERYDGERVQDLPLTRGEIEAMAENLLALTVEERKKLPGMDKSRADILGGGALLAAELMKKMSLSRIYASDRDNLEGYLRWRGLE